MLEPIQFEKVKCIVELGPGTGIITHELLAMMPKDSTLLVFEINEEFCEILREMKDPRMKVISDSAENLELYLKQHRIESVDYIVSSIPFAMIPNPIVKKILDVVKKVLKPSGTFIQYQYSLNLYKRLKNLFGKVNVDFTPMNIPPAFVFVCKN